MPAVKSAEFMHWGITAEFEQIRAEFEQNTSRIRIIIILTEKEVNTGYINRVKDRGEAEVFYEVDISCIDRFRGQYYIYRVFPPGYCPWLTSHN